ncbi:hypothetical protein A3J90_07980 [candidate division WOR-1 bacterium RIFOXYC2_FULL_37_10]|uniref:HTH cro/C1-type domain-containing protein n=1 Tax=candidate division WOR-1 bacterium RIFOXYB2_FULL_37_13 TaxID=1802579 RepID=A0A1F4SF69_UNCSA|nr:MAG: hypothetical protein A2310_05205 [candidate division WOR-1 bacterium RIFOXYB2_FULL_37_13]OGC37328.1 MAG: hypothetical protein A3J90_07980 [candidate division WOR-1 bacterium RIFOXYC2_FULL_37_10]
MAVNNANETGDIVRYHREKAGLTQLGLAELAGVGKTVIFDIAKFGPITLSPDFTFTNFSQISGVYPPYQFSVWMQL